MSGIVIITPGYEFSTAMHGGKGEWLTLPKLNQLGQPTAVIGEGQVGQRELASSITSEIGDLRTDLTEEIDARILADQAFLSWQQTLEAAYGTNLADIQTQIDARATISQLNTVESTAAAARATLATTLEAQWTSDIEDAITSGIDLSSYAEISYVDSAVAGEAAARASSEATLTAAYEAADASLQSQIDGHTTDIAARATITQLNTVASDAAAANASLSTTLTAAYEADDAALQTQIDDAVADIAANVSSLATINTTLSTHASDIAANASSITTLDAAYQAADAGLQSQIDGHTTDIAARATITQLNTVASDAAAANASLSTTLTTAYEADDAALQTQIDDAVADIAANVSSLATINTTLSTHASDIAANASSITTLDAAYQAADASLQSQIDDHTTDIAARATITQLNTVASDAAAANASLATSLEAQWTADIEAATGVDLSAYAEITYVDSAVASEASARASSEAALTAAYEADDAALQDQIDDAVADIATNLSSISTINTTLSTHATDIAANASSITTLDAAYQAADASLQSQVDDAVSDIAANVTAIAARATITQLNTVASDAAAANASLSTTLTAAYQADDAALQTQIDDAVADIATNLSSISTINTTLSTHATDIAANASSITTLDAAYQAADASLQTQIDDAVADIAANVTAIASRATITQLNTVESDAAAARAALSTSLTSAYEADDAAISAAFASADAGLQSQIDGHTTDIAARATITQLNTVESNAASARATLSSTLTAAYEADDAAISASVTALSSATADSFGHVETFYSLSLNANGAVAGSIQLSSTQDASAGTPTSYFDVVADKFRVVAPTGEVGNAVFSVDTSTNEVTVTNLKVAGSLISGFVDLGAGANRMQILETGIIFGDSFKLEHEATDYTSIEMEYGSGATRELARMAVNPSDSGFSAANQYEFSNMTPYIFSVIDLEDVNGPEPKTNIEFGAYLQSDELKIYEDTWGSSAESNVILNLDVLQFNNNAKRVELSPVWQTGSDSYLNLDSDMVIAGSLSASGGVTIGSSVAGANLDTIADLLVQGTEATLQLMAVNAGSAGAKITLSNETKHWQINNQPSSNALDFRYGTTSADGDVFPSTSTVFQIGTDGNLWVGSERMTLTGSGFEINGVLRLKKTKPTVADANTSHGVDGYGYNGDAAGGDATNSALNALATKINSILDYLNL